MPLHLAPHNARWPDKCQEALLQPLCLSDVSSATQNLYDAFSRTQAGLLLVFSQVVHGLPGRLQAEAADLLQVGTSLVDLPCFMPGAVNNNEMTELR